MSDHPELDTGAALAELTARTRRCLADQNITRPCVLGIATGGAWVAERLHAALKDEFQLDAPPGVLNIGFYRDDLNHRPGLPKTGESHLPWTVDGADIVLVDDVLYTGRTVRAAMNAVFDYGRPRRLLLCALVNRAGRELPIAADAAGLELDLPADLTVELAGPDPLRLTTRLGAA